MKNNIIQSEMDVKGSKINVVRVGGYEYISLTDLARTQNDEAPADVVKNWLRNKETISFLGVWEELNNEIFKVVEFDQFKNEAGRHAFTMSPQKWIRETNAIGIISKSGKYGGGTFARSDIAFEFASWISPEFKLYLIKEFERLKRNETYQEKIEWHANRLLSKLNYVVHTDAIKNNLIPKEVTQNQINMIYADEADIINVALFGMTAREWKQKNPNKQGNIRDYANVAELVCLVNLENLNSVYINEGINSKDRLVKLNNIAIHQMTLLTEDNRIKKIENIAKDKKLYLE